MNKDKIWDYFVKYWAFENPQVLTYGDEILDALFQRWLKVWDYFPDGMEGKLGAVGKNFEYELVGKKYYNNRRRKKK